MQLNRVAGVSTASSRVVPSMFALVLLAPLGAAAQEISAHRLTAASISTPKTVAAEPSKADPVADESFRLNEEGVELVFQGRKEEGLAKIERSIELNPKNSTALYNLAGLYIAQGKAPEAVSAMEKAIALDPADLSFLNRAAEANFANNNLDKAVHYYERLTKIEPQYEQALFRLGTLYAMQRKWEGAEKVLRQALSHQKNDARVLNGLGTVLVMRGKFNEATPFLERAHKLAPCAESAMSLGIAYEGLKNSQAALKYYEEAKSLGSQDPDLSRRISELKEGPTK